MSKKKVLVPTAVLASSFLFTSLAAAAELPSNSLILGEKGYSVQLLDNAVYTPELQDAARDAAGVMVWNTPTNELRSIIDLSLIDKGVIPNKITYKNAAGEESEIILDEQQDELKVESVSAINTTSVALNFNIEVEKLVKDNVAVVNKESGEKIYVKAVTLAKDGKSATVDFYEPLASKQTYTFTVTSGEVVASADYDFVVGKIAKIEIANQVVPAGDETEIKFKAFDETGLDVTADVKGDVTFESTNTSAITDGKVTLGDGATAFVIVKYDKDGTTVKSDRVTIKGENRQAAELVNWTVATTKPSDWKDEKYKQNTLVKLEGEAQKVFHQFKDQFGDLDKVAANSTVTFESLDKSVVLVDQKAGSVTPIKAGTAPVKIMVTKTGETKPYFTKTVEITVGEEADVATIELKEAEITLSSSLGTKKEVKLTFKDQFGDKKTIANDVVATVKTGSDIITLDGTKVANKPEYTKTVTNANEIPFNITPVKGKEGTATIEFTIKDTDIKTTLTVNVEKAAEIADYTVDNFKAELDKANTDNDKTKSPKAMELQTYAVDANGVKAEPVTVDVTYAIKDDKGKYVTAGNGNWNNAADGKITIDSTTENLFEADKTYTLIVKVGSLEVFQDSFKVVDTTEKPVVRQIKNTVNVTNSDNGAINLITFIKKDFFEVTFSGTVDKDAKVTGLKFNSDNTSVIDSVSAITEAQKLPIKGEGDATLVISEVAVEYGEGVSATVKLDAQLKVVVDFDKMAEAATEVKFGNTPVDGVNPNYEDGKVTISYEYKSLPESIDQNPNENLGADPETKYVGMEIKAPTGATHVGQLGEIVKLGAPDTATTTDGRLFYFGFAKEIDGKLTFLGATTSTQKFVWYDDDKNVVAVSKIVIEREAFDQDAYDQAKDDGENGEGTDG